MNDYFDTNNCFNRLPCGICTRTNEMCPFVSNSVNYKITCNGTAIDPIYKGEPTVKTNARDMFCHKESPTDGKNMR